MMWCTLFCPLNIAVRSFWCLFSDVGHILFYVWHQPQNRWKNIWYEQQFSAELTYCYQVLLYFTVTANCQSWLRLRLVLYYLWFGSLQTAAETLKWKNCCQTTGGNTNHTSRMSVAALEVSDFKLMYVHEVHTMQFHSKVEFYFNQRLIMSPLPRFLRRDKGRMIPTDTNTTR